ncbi:transmembrane protease serine 9-like [Cylas formicarius]|uniref:transmembrane protease serine 9-like n=1 Tax=Cylas formicarius TaxID=197179 RepID=UPI002958C44E|nr:transmembrane protease serine 9-like [Cylas formicarius]
MLYNIFALLALALPATIQAAPAAGRIVNGTNATQGEFPYMVSIRLYDGTYHECGGSIIGPRWILTAGHCIDEDISSVRYGTIVLHDGSYEAQYDIKVAKQHLHPDFINRYNAANEWLFANDIALLELVQDLPYGPNVQPLRLPEQEAATPINKTATLTGWGYTDAFYHEPLTLQKVNLTVYPYNYCDRYLTAPFDPVQNLCAGVLANDEGQCNGDSGGPLVVDGVQAGVVSWSVKPCISAPGVFTRVSHFRDWIKSVSGIRKQCLGNIMEYVSMLIVSLASLVTLGQAVPAGRIVNGTNATQGEFPYMVSIRIYGGFFHECGGSIIGPRWILTAGHCIDEDVSSVRFGTIVLDDDGYEAQYDIKVANQYLHPNFTNGYTASGDWLFANDIALLELSGDLPYGPEVQPLPLPEQDAPTPVNETAILTGWGYLDAFYDEPLTLQKVNLTVYPYNYCDQYLPAPFDPAQNLCAGVSANDQGQCNGDSGGPLVVNGVQIGIVSWSVKPCISAPGVFTRVSPFRNWIRAVSGI